MRHVILAILIAAAPAAMGLEAGIAVRSILPDPLLPVSGGMGLPLPAKEAYGEISTRALVLRDGDTTTAFVSIDSIGFPSVLGDRIREQVKDIPGENIIVTATHTHSAPDTYAFPIPGGGHTGDLDYMNWVCLQAAAAVNQAVKELQPATLKIATGEAKGKIAYNYYAPQLYDPRCSVIQAIDADGIAFATLVNYASHPEVLGPKVGVVSPDFVGPLYDRIAEKTGGTGIFINGALGGMITADNRDLDQSKPGGDGVWEDTQSWEECVRIGNRLADEALRIVSEAEVQESPALYVAAKEVTYPVDNDVLWMVVVGSPLNYPRDEDNRTISTQMNLVNIGNAQIVTIPGEALPNIGYYLKRKMHGEHNLLFGLANDAFGYILTKEDFNSFKRYDYITETSLGEQTGPILVQEALAFADESPRPEATE